MDKLFQNETVRHALEEFETFDVDLEQDMSCSTMACPDSVEENIVDGTGFLLDEQKRQKFTLCGHSGVCGSSQINLIVDGVTHTECSPGHEKVKRMPNKGGVIADESRKTRRTSSRCS